MSNYDISVRYVGNGVENGSIPVSDLAPSLLGLSEALGTVQEELFPDSPKVSLNIRATEKGSFIVDMTLLSNIIDKTINFLTGDGTSAVINLAEVVGAFVAAMKLVKAIHGKKGAKKQVDGDKVKITYDDHTEINTTINQINIVQNINFRDGIQKFATPVKKSDIDEIKFTEGQSEEKTIISKVDVDVFDTPEIGEKELDTTTQEVFLNIVNVAFENGKWKFSNGATQFFAKILDNDFLKKVGENEIQFGSTDTLKVTLETKQTLSTNGKLHSEYTILKVSDHHKGSKQLDLF